MKKIYSICAIFSIAVLISYGLITNNFRAGIMLVTMVLAIWSFCTIYPDSDVPDGQRFLVAVLGILLTYCCITAPFTVDPGKPYWLTLAIMIAILSFQPSPATMYFVAGLLGTSGTLTFLDWQTNGFSTYLLFNFGCILVFALSTWIRVYLSSKNGRT